jgi:signal transduction histidine kinase
MLTEVDSLKAIASGRFIFVRWFLLFAGILAIGLAAYFDSTPSTSLITNSHGPFIGLLFLAAILNIFVLIAYNSAARQNSHRLLSALNIFQVVLDLLLAFAAIFLLSEPTGLLPLILFVPVIEAFLVFEPAGALLVALVAAGGLVGSSYLAAVNLSLAGGLFTLSLFGTGWDVDRWLFAGFYLIFVALMSYFTDIIKSRGLHSASRFVVVGPEQGDSPSNEVARVQWIKKYSDKLEDNSRLLRSKEIELSLAKEELAALENAKSEFISVTTHQLRTPLSAIKWTFNMILTEQLGSINTEQKEFLDKGYQSTLRMISIVNNLVHIDHATAEREAYNFVSLDMAKLIENVMFEFSNQAESKKITLGFDRPTATLPQVEGDESKIRMMLENLIDNAIKYTPKSGTVTIKLSDDKLNSASPSLHISVSDSGVGIPSGEQSKIFHKFFRASNARRAEPDGSGIGLYIARDVADRHQGTIRFESLEGHGTTFHVEIPIHQNKQAEV